MNLEPSQRLLPHRVHPNRVHPKKLLVVSADIGEGHNATARAVEERARRLWPGCEIRRIDTLERMGRGVGPGFRWIYRVNVDTTPWLYDFFYRSLWRYRWFAASSCRVVGVWSGIRLAPVIEEYRPDLVVSTYPLGTGGLDWIRRRGGLDLPVAAIISDFAPHPFWVYSEVDLHYVASQPSLQAMYRARPDARGAVGAPPVVSAFQPTDKIAARRHCGLPERGLIVLVSCGSLGFGSMERAVAAGLAAGPDICVVVACGRNEALRARLVARAKLLAPSPAQRLVALGWTSEMPALTAAADVVVTNAGGATALETVACGRAVLMFEPIAGHGKANAELMAQAGLATVCNGPAELIDALRGLATQPAQLAGAQQRALTHIGALDLDAEIAALPGLVRHHGARPLSAPDAFFAHAATPTVPQQVGAVLMLAEAQPAGSPQQLADHLAGLITDRVPALPMLRRRLDLRPGRRPRWLPVDDVDPAQHLQVRTVGTGHGIAWSAALREFFGTPVALDAPPWQLAVVHDAGTGRTALLAKMHHSLGDGLAVTATLIELLCDHDDPRVQRAQRGYSSPVNLAEPAERGTWGSRARHVRRVVRGLVSLARAGPAPAVGLVGGLVGANTATREYAMVELPAVTVRATARAHGVSTTALLLALVGEALHRTDPVNTAVHDRLRVVTPRTTQAVRRAGGGGSDDYHHDGSYQGNHTAALALDLPVGPMPPTWRIVAVAEALARLQRADQPVAAQAVVDALGRLPAPLHAKLVRLIYGRRYFSVITSVLPGPRKAHYVEGVRLTSVFPVLPLADGVGLAVGFLTWGDMIGVGVSADTGLVPDPTGFAGALRRAFADLATDAPRSPIGSPTGSPTGRPTAHHTTQE
ncbi:MAG: WS/DGAT domain-containing protein [Actinomycetota bacterium]|nr:WS/DGAT domain-containing protein [Actinomycetota bacterium]